MNNYNFENDIVKIVDEIFDEKHLSPMLEKKPFHNFVKEGAQDINEAVGTRINYSEDLKARSLLKNYVLYASKNLLHIFKVNYMEDYVSLQFKYNRDTDL